MDPVSGIDMSSEELPEYDYAQRLAECDPEALEVKRGSIFEERQLEFVPRNVTLANGLDGFMRL